MSMTSIRIVKGSIPFNIPWSANGLVVGLESLLSLEFGFQFGAMYVGQ